MNIRKIVPAIRNKQIILALLSGIAVSSAYILIVFEYCVTVVDPISPDPNGYYQQIAKFPKFLAFVIFIASTTTFSVIIERRYKTFATTFFLVVLLISILSLFLIKTKVSIGI